MLGARVQVCACGESAAGREREMFSYWDRYAPGEGEAQRMSDAHLEREKCTPRVGEMQPYLNVAKEGQKIRGFEAMTDPVLPAPIT